MMVRNLTMCTCNRIFSFGDLPLVSVLMVNFWSYLRAQDTFTIYPLTALPARLTDLRDLERDLPRYVERVLSRTQLGCPFVNFKAQDGIFGWETCSVARSMGCQPSIPSFSAHIHIWKSPSCKFQWMYSVPMCWGRDTGSGKSRSFGVWLSYHQLSPSLSLDWKCVACRCPGAWSLSTIGVSW